MEQQQLKNTIEAILMSAEKPLKVNQMEAMFAGDIDMPSRNEIRKVLQELTEEYQARGFELKEVASGFRIQVKQDYAEWVGRLWEEKPARYTRALLETLALIAYRQPITRGEIEEVRGVSVSSNIIKTLQEREWIKVLGHKDVPGKPALYGTSKEFLDYFNLKSLDELPTLAELKDLDQIHQELDLDLDNTAAQDDQQQDEHHQDGQPPEDVADDRTKATVVVAAEGSDTEAETSEAEASDAESVDAGRGEAEVTAAKVSEENDTDAEASEPDETSAESAVDEQAGDVDAEEPVTVVADDALDEDLAEPAKNDEAEMPAITTVDGEALAEDMDEEEPQPQSVAN
jgi:segregation and condensation protein B